MVTIRIGGKEYQYEDGIKYEVIAEAHQNDYLNQIALVTVNGKIRELMKRVDRDCDLTFITCRDAIGHKTYVRTAIMLLMKAVKDVAGLTAAANVKVEFAIGAGYYCAFRNGLKLDADQIEKVKERMGELVDMDLLVTKKAYPADEAVALFAENGMKDKVSLFRYRRSSNINVYCMGDYYDYFYGYMMPSTGYIRQFDLFAYEEGMILLLPEQEDPETLPDFQPRKKLFQTLIATGAWGEDLGIDTVGDLNDQICSGSISDMILVQEALQERRIGEIARDIARREGVKFVMIAGPSSSGKTTFSHRLSIQLRTYGLKPHPIGLDNYYVNHDKTPRDADGKPDFECLEALDVEQFNQDMTALLAGEEVQLPTFNFKTGKREYSGKTTKLGPDDILVIEGIHGLNEKMSYSLPAESKYKIYISALTTLNVDEHNRIPTTDNRLLRRIVRDARTRGASATRTIAMWPSVRRGEEQYIFPYQEEADAMFNSALLYELAVLKQYAEPLLFGIKKGEPEYYEAKRLLKFLEYFLGVSSEELPKNSLCREFVGGSCFDV
ncbi:MAG: nucleoside kinase [Bacteroidales bacterium]|nr:nucleoside kinase [Bacteroidales bacterium]MCM1415469.1 nucleoside kinase [bacterium]MCM1423406.1 nucleoside kinase [bacterium]